jgi:mono/diheme cytochrome c family protein
MPPRFTLQDRRKNDMSRQAQAVTARASALVALAALALVLSPGRATAQEDAKAAGQKVYTQVCQGCHAESGDGNPGVYPPLNGSEWVSSPPARIVNILLHGLSGPVSVAGEEYNGLMPAWGGALKDPEIAAVATYIRSAWGNFASAISTAEVAAIREQSKSRTTPWTAAELVRATTVEK